MEVFKKHMEIVKEKYFRPNDFDKNFSELKQLKVLITIDDGFKSFYNMLGISKKNKIPFILFVSTEPLERMVT